MISFISWWEVKPQAHNIIAHQGTHRAFMLIGVGKLVDGCFRQKSRYSFFFTVGFVLWRKVQWKAGRNRKCRSAMK